MIMKKEQYPATPVSDLCTRNLLVNNDEMMMIRFDFKKGGIGDPHSHTDHEQVGYILEGKFELICGDEKTIVVKGDSYLAPKNMVHGVVALEDGAILDVFTPYRSEFKCK